MRCSNGPSCREALRKGWKMRFIIKMLGAQPRGILQRIRSRKTFYRRAPPRAPSGIFEKTRRSRRGQRLVASLGRALAVLPRHILDSQQDERRPRLQFNPAGVEQHVPLPEMGKIVADFAIVHS